jgi:hypothetical protein
MSKFILPESLNFDKRRRKGRQNLSPAPHSLTDARQLQQHQVDAEMM